MFAAKRDRHAVHKDRANPDRKATRLPIRRYVGDVHGIEYDKVRKGAGPYQAAIKEVELHGWHSRHSVDCRCGIEHMVVSHVVSEHSREAAIQAWMWLAGGTWHSVGTNHRRRMSHDEAHVRLIHREDYDEAGLALACEDSLAGGFG